MTSSKLKGNKEDLVFEIIGQIILILIIFGLGVYFNSLIIRIIGVLYICSFIPLFISEKVILKKHTQNILNYFGFAIILCIGIVVAYIIFNFQFVNVTENGKHYHYYYKQCPAISGKTHQEILKADAILLGYHECDHCKERKDLIGDDIEDFIENIEADEDYDYNPWVPSRYQ